MVLDASAAVDLLAGRDTSAAIADAIRDVTIAVPAHFDGEVYGALRRLDRQRKLAPGALDRIVPLLAQFRAERAPLLGLLAHAHGLGTQFSPRDAFYVALTARVRGELLTADRALARSASSVVRVRLR